MRISTSSIMGHNFYFLQKYPIFYWITIDRKKMFPPIKCFTPADPTYWTRDKRKGIFFQKSDNILIHTESFESTKKLVYLTKFQIVLRMPAYLYWYVCKYFISLLRCFCYSWAIDSRQIVPNPHKITASFYPNNSTCVMFYSFVFSKLVLVQWKGFLLKIKSYFSNYWPCYRPWFLQDNTRHL